MNVPYERTDAGGAFGIINEPAYLAMNPNARVPTMDEDGYILWESNAIVRYLGAKHDMGGLCPSDPRQHADADRWMDWQQTTAGPAILPVFWGLVRTAEADRDLAAIEAGRQAMIKVTRIMEDHLADRPYMAGDAFTMGDIPLGIITYRWLTLIQDRPQMANLEAWYDRITQRPAFKTNVLDIPLT
jgi:glutathione S-transferase